jgi:hypothetical protein
MSTDQRLGLEDSRLVRRLGRSSHVCFVILGGRVQRETCLRSRKFVCERGSKSDDDKDRDLLPSARQFSSRLLFHRNARGAPSSTATHVMRKTPTFPMFSERATSIAPHPPLTEPQLSTRNIQECTLNGVLCFPLLALYPLYGKLCQSRTNEHDRCLWRNATTPKPWRWDSGEV